VSATPKDKDMTEAEKLVEKLRREEIEAKAGSS
jgi:hypothetical protein